MKDGAAREAPLAAVVFDQLARVAARRKATVVAVIRDEHQQIGTGGGPVSGDRHGDIVNHMTKFLSEQLRNTAAGPACPRSNHQPGLLRFVAHGNRSGGRQNSDLSMI